MSVCVSLVRRYDEMADKLSGHPEDTEALVNLQRYLNTVSNITGSHYFRTSSLLVSLSVLIGFFHIAIIYPSVSDILTLG